MRERVGERGRGGERESKGERVRERKREREREKEKGLLLAAGSYMAIKASSTSPVNIAITLQQLATGH